MYTTYMNKVHTPSFFNIIFNVEHRFKRLKLFNFELMKFMFWVKEYDSSLLVCCWLSTAMMLYYYCKTGLSILFIILTENP